jgi:hypothetical protein
MHSKNSDWIKINDCSDTEEEISDHEIKASKKPIRVPVERPRSAVSIPSKCHSYTLVKCPEIRLEYQLPNSPEKYLLPIRFPALYNKIVNNLFKSRRKNDEPIVFHGHDDVTISKLKAY